MSTQITLLCCCVCLQTYNFTDTRLITCSYPIFGYAHCSLIPCMGSAPAPWSHHCPRQLSIQTFRTCMSRNLPQTHSLSNCSYPYGNMHIALWSASEGAPASSTPLVAQQFCASHTTIIVILTILHDCLVSWQSPTMVKPATLALLPDNDPPCLAS